MSREGGIKRPPADPYKLAVKQLDELFPHRKKTGKYAKYQGDPVGFGRDVLGESYAPDIVRVMESVRDNQITIVQSCTGYGKTHCGGVVSLWYLLCYSPAEVYITAAPPIGNLEKLLWGEIRARVHAHPKLFQGIDVHHLSIERTPNTFLSGLTIPQSADEHLQEAKFSGKHSHHLLFVCDEGDAIPDPVYRGIDGCLSGGMTRLLIFFNPRHKAGMVYRMIRDKKANVIRLNACNHPNVLEGQDIYPGAVSRDKTIQRINDWTRPVHHHESVDTDCYELPTFLVGETAPRSNDESQHYPPLEPGYRRVVDNQFWYKVLGEYPTAASNQLIAEDWIEKAVSRWLSYVAENGEVPPAGVSAIQSLDVAEFGDDSNQCCFRYGNFVERLIGWKGMDIDQTAHRATDLHRARRVRKCNVDGNGVGAGVAPIMTRLGCPAIGVKVQESPTKSPPINEEATSFYQLRDQLWWECREWFRRDLAMIPPDDELRDDPLAAKYEKDDRGRLRIIPKESPASQPNRECFRRLLGRSPDKGEALILSFFTPPSISDDRVINIEGEGQWIT